MSSLQIGKLYRIRNYVTIIDYMYHGFMEPFEAIPNMYETVETRVSNLIALLEINNFIILIADVKFREIPPPIYYVHGIIGNQAVTIILDSYRTHDGFDFKTQYSYYFQRLQ